jgi:hypothetical protein
MYAESGEKERKPISDSTPNQTKTNQKLTEYIEAPQLKTKRVGNAHPTVYHQSPSDADIWQKSEGKFAS